jgi:hypothetical protein
MRHEQLTLVTLDHLRHLKLGCVYEPSAMSYELSAINNQQSSMSHETHEKYYEQ